MHTLVTGGAGFIGSHVAEHFIAKGHSVTVVDSLDEFYSREIKFRNIALVRENPRCKLIVGDIRDDEVWSSLAAGEPPDVIVHLAARAGIRPSLIQPAVYADVNVSGTIKVFEFARNAGVRRVVLGSSSSVYGDDSSIPYREDAPRLAPISPYGVTKLACEQFASAYANLYDFTIASLRIFTVYGPRQRPDLAIHRFARAMLDGRSIELYGDGSMRRDFTFVDDVVQGIVQTVAWTERASGHEIFNIGASDPVSITELIVMLETALGVEANVRHLPQQAGDVRATHADTAKARRVLGYEPRTKLREGLGLFAAWLRQQPKQE